MSRDQTGRRVVITGANIGVGRATAEALARRGAHVVLACRSRERALPVRHAIRAEGGEASIVTLDLADLRSVARAAGRIAEAPFDVLIDNAGVGGARGVTADGFELAFGVNYLGHFALTRALLGSLRPGGRVVHLGSGSHERAPGLDLEAARRPTRSFTGVPEYAHSKLCVMLFHAELSRRLAGTGLSSVAADPGDVASEAYRHVPWPVRAWMTRGMKAPAEGARAPSFCATDARAQNGRLYEAGREGVAVERAPSERAADPALAAELWRWSEAQLAQAARFVTRPGPRRW